MSPQLRILVRHFRNNKSIHGIEAILLYQIQALPRRIKDLEEWGYQFNRRFEKNAMGRRYRVYSLVERPKHLQQHGVVV